MQSIALIVVAVLIGAVQSASASVMPRVPDAGATGLLLVVGMVAVAGTRKLWRARK